MNHTTERVSYVTVPEGTYTVRAAELRHVHGPKTPGVRLEITDGPYAGRTAAWAGASEALARRFGVTEITEHTVRAHAKARVPFVIVERPWPPTGGTHLRLEARP